MGTRAAGTSISGGMLRSASLCPRLAVHKAWFPREDIKVGAAGGEVVNGNLFHSHVVGRILEDLARVEARKSSDSGNAWLRQVIGAHWNSKEDLRSELWRIFAQAYLAPALHDFSSHLGKNPGQQIQAMTQGIGKLAELCAEIHLDNGGAIGKTRRFLPPEGVLQSSQEVDGLTVELVGNYDGLWFDESRGEFVLIDFKCKTPAEFPSDLHQLACYAWLIHQVSGRPIRGVLVYVQPEAVVRHLSAKDLAATYPESERFVRRVAQWLITPKGSCDVVPQTSIPDLCQRCPLDVRCDALYGQRQSVIA